MAPLASSGVPVEDCLSPRLNRSCSEREKPQRPSSQRGGPVRGLMSAATGLVMSSGAHSPGGGLGAQSVPLTSCACRPDGGLSPLASSAQADGQARPVLPGDRARGQCEHLTVRAGSRLSVPFPLPLPAAWASFLIPTPGGWAQGLSR